MTVTLIQYNSNTRLMAFCPWLLGEPVPVWIYWSKRQWVSVASAGPYANLHLAWDRQPRQHPTTQFFTGRMPFLLPNHECQSTEGNSTEGNLEAGQKFSYHSTSYSRIRLQFTTHNETLLDGLILLSYCQLSLCLNWSFMLFYCIFYNNNIIQYLCANRTHENCSSIVCDYFALRDGCKVLW